MFSLLAFDELASGGFFHCNMLSWKGESCDPIKWDNRIGGVMVSMLASSVVDRGFDPGRIKPKTKIGICCFSAKHAALRRKSRLVGLFSKTCIVITGF
jgi:hypothetical protein